MRVGALYAVLRLEKGQFEAALATSKTKFAMFANFLRATGLLAAQVLAVIVVGSLAAATTFEQHMNQALAIMGDVSAGVRKQMEDAARAVAKTSTFSANEAADAYFFLASAGLTAAQSIKALPVVTQFAQAGVMDLERATELLLDAQTTMGLRSQDAAENMRNMARVSDVLSAAQIHSNATLEQMAESLVNKAGPALRVVGKDIEEGAAALMVLANRGVKGREAGTQLAIVLRELQTKAIKNADAFKEMGVRVFDASGEMRGLPEIIGDLEDAFEGMTDKERKEALIMMGFTDRSVGFIQALLGSSDQMAKFERQLRRAGGTTETVANKQLNTLQNQLVLLWHKVVDVAISIGQKLLPGVKEMVKQIGAWIDKNGELIADIVVNVVGGIGKLISVIVKGATVFWQIFGPAIMVVVDAFDEALDRIGDFYDGMSGLAKHAGGDSPLAMIGGLVSTLAEAFDHLVNDVIPSVMDAVGPLLSEVFTTIGEVIAWFADEVLPRLVVIFTLVADEIVPRLADALDWLATEVVPKLTEAFNWFNENVLPKLMELFTGVLDWVIENWPTISAIVSQVMGAMASAIVLAWNVASAVIGFVVPIIWGIIEPIASVLFPLIGGAASVLLSVISVVFTTIGLIWQGVADAAGVLVASVVTAWNFLAAITTAIWNGIGSAIKFVINGVIDTLNGFFGFLNGMQLGIPHVVIPNPFGGTLVDVGGGVIDPFNIGLIPHLAAGTRNFAGGLAVVGEEGPELVRMPGGSGVFTNAELREMMDHGGKAKKVERHGHIHLSGQASLKTASDAVKMWERLEFLDG